MNGLARAVAERLDAEMVRRYADWGELRAQVAGLLLSDPSLIPEEMFDRPLLVLEALEQLVELARRMR